MKKLLIVLISCLVMAGAVIGCSNTTETPAPKEANYFDGAMKIDNVDYVLFKDKSSFEKNIKDYMLKNAKMKIDIRGVEVWLSMYEAISPVENNSKIQDGLKENNCLYAYNSKLNEDKTAYNEILYFIKDGVLYKNVSSNDVLK